MNYDLLKAHLKDFIKECDQDGVTPAENEINKYLNRYRKWQFREMFVKFCFYHWEDRYDNNIIKNAIRELK